MKKIWVSLLVASSYFLAVPAPAQTSANVPAKSNSSRPVASGPAVLGVFEGRFPCQEVAGQLQLRVGTHYLSYTLNRVL